MLIVQHGHGAFGTYLYSGRRPSVHIAGVWHLYLNPNLSFSGRFPHHQRRTGPTLALGPTVHRLSRLRAAAEQTFSERPRIPRPLPSFPQPHPGPFGSADTIEDRTKSNQLLGVLPPAPFLHIRLSLFFRFYPIIQFGLPFLFWRETVLLHLLFAHCFRPWPSPPGPSPPKPSPASPTSSPSTAYPLPFVARPLRHRHRHHEGQGRL